ncbi:uncharacterized protein [Vicugna pacos]|uniref:F-box domain-containing protein n=1 Tax=Vicugna pacos TaxID=30538 RepID=A0ABM5DU22_VICPA
MAESLPLEILTYILSFLPLSDQKEASLVSQAWYCAAQNALREPHRELEHQASSPKNPSPQPQDPSLLTLQALRELDLTACSAPVPPAEAVVTEPVARTYRQGLGGCGQGLSQPGALGAESLQPPQRQGLGPGSQLLAEAAASQPVQLQSAYRANTGYHWASVQATPDVRCGHVSWHQHGFCQVLPSPTAPGARARHLVPYRSSPSPLPALSFSSLCCTPNKIKKFQILPPCLKFSDSRVPPLPTSVETAQPSPQTMCRKHQRDRQLLLLAQSPAGALSGS